MTVVMWNILAGDWDKDLKPEKCYQRVMDKTRPGDIIVFHDSDKAWDRMSYSLPLILEEFTRLGYRFMTIN